MLRKGIYIASFLLFFYACSNGNKKLNENLNKMAVELNQSAPVQLDENTLFLGADVTADNVFQYKYQIIQTQNPDSLLDATEHQIFANLKDAFKLNPDLKVFTQHDLNIEYIYVDSNGVMIRTIEITPENYK